MKIINWTKHTVNIQDQEGKEVAAIEPSGFEARIETEVTKTGSLNGIPLFYTKVIGTPFLIDETGNKEEIPQQNFNTIYIVSGKFKSYCNRPDFWQPGKLIRDDKGNVIASVGLSR